MSAQTDTVTIESVDPRSAAPTPSDAIAAGVDELDAAVAAARASAAELDVLRPAGRAALLDSMADHLLQDADRLVATCMRETGLPEQRLRAELARTAYQLRFLGRVAVEGSYLDLTVDHASETEMGPIPDLRLMNVPLGVVGVFAASNFPFAFSVGGGDVASAIAAGCPVVVKGHDAHPQTSVETFRALQRGIAAVGGPEGTLGIVFGRAAGTALVAHTDVKAIGFTGSVAGGQALARIAADRPDPIPFFGELGSVNPFVVTPAAAASRAAEIGEGVVGSFTLGTGQFCTKPGLVFVPEGPDGDSLVAAARDAVTAGPAGYMLSGAIFERYSEGAARLAGSSAIARRTEGPAASDEGFAARAVLLETTLDDFSEDLTDECFGPLAIVVRYSDPAALVEFIAGLPGALTGTIHAETDDAHAGPLVGALGGMAGRIIWNGYPTGVGVTWAMHHGGPWPAAADARQTSVGAYAIRRWVRPVSWQGFPQQALPEELRDGFDALPRRIDGVLLPART